MPSKQGPTSVDRAFRKARGLEYRDRYDPDWEYYFPQVGEVRQDYVNVTGRPKRKRSIVLPLEDRRRRLTLKQLHATGKG